MPEYDRPQFTYRPRASVTKRIIIHASRTKPGIENTVAWLRVRGRENGLLDVGYHFVIERSGHLVMTRPVEVMGSHTPGHNHDSIGVCFANDGAGEYPTPEQVEALRCLVGYLQLPVVGVSEAARIRNSRQHPLPGFDMDRLRKDIATDMCPPLNTPGSKKLSPQNATVLEYLKAGRALTNLIAITNLGIGSLTSRVAELRDLGHNIVSTPKEDFNGRTYMSYTLVEPVNA